ncbi:MAG TPA: succinylglutamate desuccinylase/aspartoacylase family protein [Candidatus Acidoferrum sp.]|nr:succinylglutamate desuccinylase/aspartoacylase family protein [Candidatus Acidoferrum sp.]
MADLFTNNDFRHGRPQVLMQADKHPKILLLWQHGDERLGPDLGYYLYSQRPDLLQYVDYLCGNPQAASQDPPAHWTDADLNRSYGQSAEPTYETKRAREIVDIIRQGNYEYVLDVHTSVTDVGHFAIAPRLSTAVRRLIAASDEQRVVVLSPDLYQVSLAGQFEQVLALEYNQALADQPETLEQLATMLDRLAGLQPATEPRAREIFYIDGPIPKAEDPGVDARNFELCKDGYYPVLLGTGKRSYREDPTKTYLGFAARRREEVVL